MDSPFFHVTHRETTLEMSTRPENVQNGGDSHDDDKGRGGGLLPASLSQSHRPSCVTVYSSDILISKLYFSL